ncbi:MAG: glycine betaine ABC transporter substrate-binding protein [Bacteroidota bacterium]
MNGLEKFFDFILANREEMFDQVLEHLWLTILSLTIATIIGLSLGIFISKKQRAASTVLGFVNAVQTIPSIALLGFLLPFLGIGATPAIVALFLYALLPIVRNTHAGITGVTASIREAAVGMGLNSQQVLFKVELPLAMPVIFAGIRTAFVINVGVATLCALIAAGGLGEFIFRGLTTNNSYMILAGAIPAALMALTFDIVMGWIQPRIYQLGRPLLVGVLLIFIFTIIYQFTGQTDSTKLEAGFPSEFIERGDGYQGLKNTYGLDLKVREMEIGLMYQAVKNSEVDLISGFSTDGRIKAFDLVTLEDDKNYFPPYHAAPLIRMETLKKYPELKDVFERLDGKISDDAMAKMNYLVDEEKQDITKVARDFLQGIGLKTEVTRAGTADLVIGSKAFTESFILAEVFKLLVENYTGLTVDLKLGFGGTKLLFDAMNNGDVDIYPEYTGTGLLVILKPEEDKGEQLLYKKDVVFNFVEKEFRRKYEIQWMSPLGFNNTFAIMMQRTKAEELKVKKVSDLSKF